MPARKSRATQANHRLGRTALCYVRQSFTRDKDDNNSPERQKANIQAVCDRQGWVPEWFVDAEGHKSGTQEKNRPGWLALKARLQDPDVVALVANDLARIHRKAWHVGRTLEMLDELGVRLVFAAPGRDLDTATPQGRLLINFLAMQDEAYANDVAQRSQDSIQHRKGRGITVGMPPFGTIRNREGYLVPSPEGAWLLPDGSWTAGVAGEEPPHPEALWRAYYDAARRVLELYVRDLAGYNSIAQLITNEGFAFRDRWKNPRLFSSDDVRRITSNWREYAGIIVDGRAKEKIAAKLNEPSAILHDTGRAVFDLDLLRQVAQVQEKRSMVIRPTGSVKTVYDYALLRLVYCAHCDRIATEQHDPRRRSRLSGTRTDRARYRHAEGVQCGCKRRSIPAEFLEQEFLRLVSLLTLREDALHLMVELSLQSEHKPSDDAQLEEQKKAAIARHRRKIEAARFLFEEGDLSREEFVRRKEENERMIAHWEARTSETERKALEFSTCMAAMNRLVELWPQASGQERLTLARSLFEYVAFDLDTQQITDFRLHPWADEYLILRDDLYGPEDGSGGDLPEEKKTASSFKKEAVYDPNGRWNQTFTHTGYQRADYRHRQAA